MRRAAELVAGRCCGRRCRHTEQAELVWLDNQQSQPQLLIMLLRPAVTSMLATPSTPPSLAWGCMVMSDSTMHSTSDRVMREMLREQSAPPGANQWYSRPAIVMQPAQRVGRHTGWLAAKRACERQRGPRTTGYRERGHAVAAIPALTCVGAQRDAQQRVEVAPVLLPSLHPGVVPVLGHVLRV